ncbi:MAG: septum formation initiator family protein [Bacilli bacterium]|nr:septum formation initiator family protein [Bacilli bacterium]
MAKRKVKKKSIRILTFGTLSAFIIVYFLFSLGNYAIKLHSLKTEQSSLKTELKDLKSEEELLKAELTKLKDSNYLARFARENYLYTKDGEYVIQIQKSEDENNSKSKVDLDYELYLAIGIFSIFTLIIIYILYKATHQK